MNMSYKHARKARHLAIIFTIVGSTCATIAFSDQKQVLINNRQELRSSASVSRTPESRLSKELAQLKPSDTTAHMRDNIKSIEAAIEECGTSDPWAAKAFYMLGMMHYNLHELKEAREDFNTSISLPEPIPGIRMAAQNMRMNVASELGDTKGAIAASQDLEKTPAPPEVRSRLVPSSIMLRAEWQTKLSPKDGGGPGAATNTYKSYVEQAAKSKAKGWQEYTIYAYRALAASQVQTGDVKGAIQTYDRCLKRFPKEPSSVLVAMERLRLKRGGKPETMLTSSELLSILKMYPSDTGAAQHVWYELAMAYAHEKKFDKAIQILRQIMRFHPKPGDKEYNASLCANAGIELAQLLEIQGRHRESMEALREVRQSYQGMTEATVADNVLKKDSGKVRDATIFRLLTVAVPMVLVGMVAYVRLRKISVQE